MIHQPRFVGAVPFFKDASSLRSAQVCVSTSTKETMISIHIPVTPNFAGIAPGSGIVAGDLPGVPSHTVLYFEGNLMGAENLKTWAERVVVAAGRLHQRYPTVARKGMPVEEAQANLVRVGHVDPDTWEVTVDATKLSAVVVYAQSPIGNVLLENGGTHYDVLVSGRSYGELTTLDDEAALQLAFNRLRKDKQVRGAMVEIRGGAKPLTFAMP